MKLQAQIREKIEGYKLSEENIKNEYNQNNKKRGQYEQQLFDKIKELQFEIQGMNHALMIAKENEFRFLEREEDNRLELQQLKQMYSSVNIHVLELKEEVDDYHDRIENGRRNQNQMSTEISLMEGKYNKMVT